ncbi:MAG: ribose-phosphate diphosphokinase [Deltaproteobacteria bacterium]|nr:ribose-phosphate diphosphokinase [Deltaproteobacteria bacterium]
MEMFKVFCGSSNRDLAQKICERLGTKLGDALVTRFRDGEVRVQIQENVRKCHVCIVQSTHPPAEHWDELYFLIDAARRGSAAEITAVIPYFGYSRQERKDAPRVPISLKVKMDHVVSAGADRILTMDLHAGASQGFVNIPVDHLYGPPMLLDKWATMLNGAVKRPILASDLGFSKVASHYARQMGCDFVPCRKVRKPNVVLQAEIIGSVENADILYIDDMIDTGGTVRTITQVLKQKGASTINVAVTHGIFGKGWDNPESGLIEAPIDSVIFTDTIAPRREVLETLASKMKVSVVSTAKLFARSIREIVTGGSVGEIFDDWESRVKSIVHSGSLGSK